MKGFEIDRFEKLVLFAAVTVFAGLKLTAHYRFGTSFDSALFGNVAWRIGNGLDSVSSLTGFRYFATHASLVVFPLALVFNLWPQAGLPVAFIWQAISVVLIGIAVLMVAKEFGLTRSTRRLLLVLTLASPGALLATRLDVHEPTLGLGFLAMTMAAGLSRVPLRRMWWWPLLAAACRIEMAAATVVAGALLAKYPTSRRAGWFSVGAGLAGLSFSLWFVLRSGTEAASVAAHFSHLGSTVGEVARTAFSRPIDVLRPLAEPVMLSSLMLWLLPMGLILPVLGWRYLLLALPTAGVAILGVWPPADQFPHHYWYGFLVAAPIATAEALRRRPDRLKIFKLTAGLGLAFGWAGLIFVAGAFGPLGRSDTAAMREAVTYLAERPAASVSVHDNVVPHVLGREEIYVFPRPFLCSGEAIGPFAWSGKPPEYVVVLASERDLVDRHTTLGPILDALYGAAEPGEHISVYRLKATAVTGMKCVGP